MNETPNRLSAAYWQSPQLMQVSLRFQTSLLLIQDNFGGRVTVVHQIGLNHAEVSPQRVLDLLEQGYRLSSTDVTHTNNGIWVPFCIT